MSTKFLITLLTFLFKIGLIPAQFNFDSIFKQDVVLKKISSQAAKYHLQIIYTQIEYKNGIPSFKDYFFNPLPDNYFYCASLVKLPVSILAVEKLNDLKIPISTTFFTDSSRTCHRTVRSDTTSVSHYPSVEHYIKKMFLVSDNEAYSRVYEFLGVEYIHQRLTNLGFPKIQIINRYDGNCTGKDNFISNPVTFLDENLKPIYHQGEMNAVNHITKPIKNASVGAAYYNSHDKKIKGPKNFSEMNYLSLADCHSILKELLYNQENKFKISEEQRAFLSQYLSLLPRQSNHPIYSPKTYFDGYKKFLFYGNSKNPIADTNLIITNIVGQSYGFLSDCARFKDKKNNIEFMLSAVIYSNENNIINDGKYDYKTIGFPYLAELGRQFYNYELRKKIKE